MKPEADTPSHRTHDITNRRDVERLVGAFYEKVRANDVLEPIFSEVARLDWSAHLPRMYDFWAGILLDEHAYSGNPMLVHLALSRRTEMGDRQFGEWLRLFNDTVDGLFAGEKAELAKTRAGHIARLMQHKIRTA